MAEEEQDFSKLSLEDRCGHKNWKARVSAYEELIKLFPRIDDDKEWGKYAGWVRKFPTDSNAAAQEKALEATLLFLEYAVINQAGRIVAELMNGIVAKCITASKAKSKEMANSIALMCVEVEKFEAVQEELMKGMDQKNPKVVAGCIAILTEILRAFGPTVISLKTLLKKLPGMTEDRDKTVREETKKLMVELYRWLGLAFKPQLNAVKELIVKDVETEYEKCKDKPVKTRYLRSQQAKKEREDAGDGNEDEGDGGEGAEDASAPEIDPLDLIDPVDILSKLPKDFHEKCEAKKWQERKEAMESLDSLITANPKLEPGDYSDVIRALRKMVSKDSNVLVVALAAKCIGGLANGLKKKFSPYAAHCISTVLEKFKEKKPNVVAALREAIDNSFVATSLETIQEDVVAALNGKNPQVKIETNSFLARVFAKTPHKIMSDKKLMKPYFTAIVANLNESDPQVRDAAAEAFGVALKHLGEKALTPLTADLEPIKLAKVKEFCDKAVITAPKEKAQPAPPKAAPSKPAASKPAAAKSATGAKKPPAKKLPVKSKDLDDDYGLLEDLESASAAVTPEEVDDEGVTRVDISGFITEQLLNELADKKNWKTRDEALDKIRALITKHKNIKVSLGELPMALVQRLQDSNKNLANSTFLLCQNLAIALGPNAKRHTSTLAAAMLTGLGDSKVAVRATVLACINSWADNGGLNEFFQGEMIADALKNGNPYLRTELFDWLTNRLPQMKSVSKDELNSCIPHLFAGIEDRNADVRKAANEAILPFMIHLGFDAMARHASRLKPASKLIIDAQLAKAKPNLPAKPVAAASNGGSKAVRGGGGSKLPAGPAKSDSKTSAKPRAIPKSRGSPPNKKPPVEETSSSAVNLPENHMKSQRFSDEMKFKILKWNFTIPREEFVEQLKDLMTTAGFGKNLLTCLFHTDFKMHLKALDILLEEFSTGSEGTIANLDLILKWSSIRFFDTNPSVLLRILDYMVQVFQVLGSQEYALADIEANSFIPYLLQKIGDPKDTVRGSVHQIVQLLVYVYPPPHIFQYVMEGLKSKNARQRSECLEEIGIMIAAHGSGVIHPSPAVALKEIAKQIADRDNSVRNSALNALVQAYFIDEDINKLYRYVGHLSDKDQSYLDERIKRAMKNKPSAPVVAKPLMISPNRNDHPGNANNYKQEQIAEAEDEYEQEAQDMQYAEPQYTGHGMEMEVAAFRSPVHQTPRDLNCTVVRKPMSPPEVSRDSGLPEKYRINFDAIDRLYPDTGPMPPLRLLNTDINEFKDDVGYNLKNLKRSPVKPVARAAPPEPANVPPLANQSIDLVVTQIGDPTLRTSTEACVMLDAMVKDIETSVIMAGRVDTIISMVALQMRRQQPVIMSESSDKLEELNTFFKAAVGLLTAVFKGDFLPKRASKDSIREIIHHLLVLIIDENLTRLKDANPLIKMVNVMVVRIIEKCDPNAVTCGLIRLLSESLTNSASQPSRLLDLVMKCQWKLLKQYNVWWGNKEYNWDIPSILNEFYFFMKAHPFNSFNEKDITPLKTVKTILHTLALNLGVEPLQYQLNTMHELRESEAGLYLQKLIQRELSKKLQPVQVKRDFPQVVPDSARSDPNDNNGLFRAKNVNAPGTAEFLNSLPDPDTAPTVEAKAACYLQRLKMIRSRAGLTETTSKPSINLGMDLSDGEESTI